MAAPIALISALPQELGHLLTATQELSQHDVGSGAAYTGVIAGKDVVLAEARVGKVNTAITVASLHHVFGPRLYMFSGVGGGLDPDLHVGDVVVGKHSVQHDSGVLEDGGLTHYQAGHVPGFNPTQDFGWSPSRELLESIGNPLGAIRLEEIEERTPRIVLGTVATGDQYLQDSAVRQRLHNELGAAAVDMEGAAMAQAATAFDADHLVIRTLSDLAGEHSIKDFTRYLSVASANSARVILELIPIV